MEVANINQWTQGQIFQYDWFETTYDHFLESHATVVQETQKRNIKAMSYQWQKCVTYKLSGVMRIIMYMKKWLYQEIFNDFNTAYKFWTFLLLIKSFWIWTFKNVVNFVQIHTKRKMICQYTWPFWILYHN